MTEMSSAVQVGANEVNRAGIAPDRDGNPMLCFQGSPKTLDLLELLPGAAYWNEWNCLAMPLDKTNLRVMETVARLEEVTPEYSEERSRYLRPNAANAALYPLPIPGQPDPRAHQVEAFCELLDALYRGYKGFGQWSEQGLGKTRWAIDAMRFRVKNCAVVIAQNSTTYQWAEALEANWPEARICMLADKPVPKRREEIKSVQQTLREQSKVPGTYAPFVFIVNWEALRQVVDELVKLRPAVTIADEATRMIHRTTAMSKSAWKLGKASGIRIPMTGTPIAATPSDLFALFRFIDERIFGADYAYYMKYYFELGGITGKEFESFKPHRLQEFIERMYSCSYRIVKAMATDMPEKTYRQVRLDMTTKQKKLYKLIEKDMYASWETDDGRNVQLAVPNCMTKIGRLQQITAGLMPINGEEAVEPYEHLPSAKTEWLIQFFQDHLRDSDAHIVAWTRYIGERKAIMEAARLAGIVEPITFIDGSIKPRDREVIRRRFNDRSDPLRILVYQIQAGALGVDLPSADIMVYHTLPFSLLERLQSMERGLRLGRTRPYEIIDLICKASVDNDVLTALKRKQDFSDMLLTDGFAAWMDKIECDLIPPGP
jgi:SNF2 family DNA or RNA helicase